MLSFLVRAVLIALKAPHRKAPLLGELLNAVKLRGYRSPQGARIPPLQRRSFRRRQSLIGVVASNTATIVVGAGKVLLANLDITCYNIDGAFAVPMRVIYNGGRFAPLRIQRAAPSNCVCKRG